MTKQRLKILLSAYACSPYKGSEPAVGWGFISALSEHHDLWVIVEEEKFQADIERWLSEHPETARGVQFSFIKKKRNRFLRKLWPPSYYWYYRKWHKDAFTLAEKLHHNVDFDLAHQLTMVGFREPGYLWKLGVPFVWGPVGGMGLFPRSFLGCVGFHGLAYFSFYNCFNWFHERFLSRPKLAAQSAGMGLILATEENKAAAFARWGVDGHVISEVGLPRTVSCSSNSRVPGSALRLVWTGLHIDRKALNLGLRALADLPSSARWELHVLGTGPLSRAWKALACRLKISEHCHFHGQLSRDEALEVMQQNHVLLITSLRDLTSTVTIEALALGLPVICPDHCGFSDAITDECGVKVPLHNPRSFIRGLSAAIELLEQNESERKRLSVGALRRANNYHWSRKAEAVDDIYELKLRDYRDPFAQ